VTKSSRRSESIPTGRWVCGPVAYERIIAAVGERHSAQVQRDRLIFDLLAAREQLLAFMTLDSESGVRERKQLFSGVSDSAKALKQRLLDDRGHRYAAREIASRLPDLHLGTFMSSLDRIIEVTETLKDENSHGAWMRLKRPLKEWFAAEVLPKVFKSNFDREAKISRPSDSKAGPYVAGGPYIRFAVAVMHEMGVSISEETVARALKDVRAVRARRKNQPET
jgi:hypothetical protein